MGLLNIALVSTSKWNSQRKRDAAHSRRERERRARERERRERMTPQQKGEGFYNMETLGKSLLEATEEAMEEGTLQGLTLERISCMLVGKQTAEYHATYSDGTASIMKISISADGTAWWVD